MSAEHDSRSSVDGRFVTDKYAAEHQDTTVREQRDDPDDISLPNGPLHFVSAAEADRLRQHNDHLRATLSRLLIFARGNEHVLKIIHDALDWQPDDAAEPHPDMATTGKLNGLQEDCDERG